LAAGHPREIDPEALRDYFAYGYVPAPRSIFRGAHKLLPGHLLVAEKGAVKTFPYWSLEAKPDRSLSEGDWLEQLLSLLRDTVKGHLMSDVPLGAFLSGGVDSSLIVALMSEFTDGPVNTFTMGFGGGKGGFLDERGYARAVAERYGARHTEFEVQPDVEGILGEIVDAFDEPFADDSVIPSYHICRLAAQKVKVALTGLGGDEMFGGYERHLGLAVSGLYGALPAPLRGLIAKGMSLVPELKSGHYTVNHAKRFVRSAGLPPAERYRDFVSVFNDAGRRALFAGPPPPEGAFEPFSSCGAPTLLDRALLQDIATYLPEDILALSDRLSMWHGIELRVPFVDHEVVEFCARIPASLKVRRGQKKYLLKKLSRRFLPAEVIDHRKQGFAAPLAAWLRNDLKDAVSDALSPRRLARHGLLNADAVGRLWRDHQDRVELNDRKIFAVFMFQRWFERMMP
jgi:asparagine synthase (glutamine-hydrolysing)